MDDATAPATSEKLRLFIAASVPPELQRLVDETCAPLRDLVRGARWVAAANLHITLKFLGSTPAAHLEAVETAVESAARALRPSQLALSGFGAFPSARRARVLWIGVDDDDRLLARAAADLDRVLEPLGFASEARPYTPHLTVARLKTPAQLPMEIEIEDIGEPFVLGEIDLYCSRLSPKGARYEKLTSFPLGS